VINDLYWKEAEVSSIKVLRLGGNLKYTYGEVRVRSLVVVVLDIYISLTGKFSFYVNFL
jgi:hypothetical protein